MTFNPQPKPTKGKRQKHVSALETWYMLKVKVQLCCSCGCAGPNEAHHCRSDSFGGKRASGFATISLCPRCHRTGANAYHRNKRGWEEENGKDWQHIPIMLKAIYGDQYNIDH